MLSDEHAREMCLRFADMECKLGEIDRARAIYSFCSQICDPRVGMAARAGGAPGQLPPSPLAHAHDLPATDDQCVLADVEGLRGPTRQ